MQTPYPINPELSALAIAYLNPEAKFIADDILPRIPKGKSFNYNVYGKEQFMTVPNTLLGRKSEPREVEFQCTAVNDATLDYGLADYVPEDDMKVWRMMPKAPGLMDPMQVATIGVTNLVMLDRERRAANLIFNAATYAAGFSQVVGAPQQWNNYASATSDPATQIANIKDGMLVTPNTLVVSALGFTALRRHPKIVRSAFPISQNGDGKITLEQLANELELSYVRIGAAWINTAAPGLPPVLSYVWGKNAALINVSKEQAMTGMPTFGFTAEFGKRKVQTWFEPKRGVDGMNGLKVTDQVKEVIVTNEAGYYFSNIIP